MQIDRVCVLGAGSWGTALAILLAKKGYSVPLWDRDFSIARGIRATRRNPRYLAEFELPDGILPVERLEEAVSGSPVVILAVPCNAVREVAVESGSFLGPKAVTISVAKGLESSTGLRVSQVLRETLPGNLGRRTVVLSGPNLAVELARDIPTTTVVASEDESLSRLAQDLFMAPTFRAYTNSDVAGVELGGALKNVIAIGAGISDGLGYGDNTKASLMTRGLAEIIRLGTALGSRRETFDGLSGIGDLIATCASTLSRNRRVGFELARGKRLPDILAEMGQVAEGVPTTRAACALAEQHGVEMPIARAVYQVLFEDKPPLQAVAELMLRESKSEVGTG